MKLRHLFTINIVIAAFFGLSCSILPAWVLYIYGLPSSAAAIWTTRLVGGSILGFATLMWYGRRTTSTGVQNAIAFALFVQDLIGLAASLEIQLGGEINALGWSNPALYGLLTLAYAYFLLIRPGGSKYQATTN